WSPEPTLILRPTTLSRRVPASAGERGLERGERARGREGERHGGRTGRRRGADRLDGDACDVVHVPAVDARADRREGDGQGAEAGGDVERAREAGREERGVGLAAVAVRADGVDHPAGREVVRAGRD